MQKNDPQNAIFDHSLIGEVIESEFSIKDGFDKPKTFKGIIKGIAFNPKENEFYFFVLWEDGQFTKRDVCRCYFLGKSKLKKSGLKLNLI